MDCLTDAIELAETIAFIDGSDEAFVIGGAELYKHALPFVDRMHLTMVHAEVDGDTFFPHQNPFALASFLSFLLVSFLFVSLGVLRISSLIS